MRVPVCRCEYGLKVLWSAKLRDSPLTATPLLFDVDGDGYNDIVVPSFSGEVWSVHGENGHIVDNWPFYLDDRAFHASPLVVCVCLCMCLMCVVSGYTCCVCEGLGYVWRNGKKLYICMYIYRAKFSM